MTEDELAELRARARADRKLIADAAQVLGEISRSTGLSDEHTEVLAALRIRLEGKKRASLEELLEVAGDLGGKKDLGDVLASPDDKPGADWPVVEEKKRDWPGL
jgi:hypothetical protein